MVLYRKDFCFVVKVADGGHFEGTGANAEGLVLSGLEFLDV